MLKQLQPPESCPGKVQPPSGGCVLKPPRQVSALLVADPAAFRRLCVETQANGQPKKFTLPSRLQAAVC